MGFFDLIKKGLSKTVSVLNTDIRDLFKKSGRLADETFLNEMFEMFVKTDMGVAAAKEITDDVRKQFHNRIVEQNEVLDAVKTKLKSLMAQPEAPIRFAESGPTVIMVCGVNGSGKTTTIAKLTAMFTGEGKKVVLGAADTFRAAAVEQLTVWANRLGAEIVTGTAGSDPASVAHKSVAKALEIKADVCIVDTAGRLQTQKNLMQELEKIRRVTGKLIPEAPHEVILILDAATGQNGISQAKHFSEAVQCTGLVLAKLDGTAKGGVAVAIRKTMDLPVKFIGLGETAADFAVFDAGEYVEALFAGE
ncbi:MAG: signal recognition particle-docking protein FtsY [Planctomycetaceae bacterium]|jgi:fused signal recognition particle receptor|nr:signal recognition particle-docking protein FtsY [Planctomycetaceae bacterium]